MVEKWNGGKVKRWNRLRHSTFLLFTLTHSYFFSAGLAAGFSAGFASAGFASGLAAGFAAGLTSTGLEEIVVGGAFTAGFA